MSHIPRCILRESEDLRSTLQKKWKDKTQGQIIREAAKQGIVITRSSLSRYINYGNVVNSLTTEHLVRLSELYGVKLKLKIS